MSEITFDSNKVAEVVKSLKVLADMADGYADFSVTAGSTAGHPKDALDAAASQVAALARAERDLIYRIIDNVTLDAAELEAADKAVARAFTGDAAGLGDDR